MAGSHLESDDLFTSGAFYRRSAVFLLILKEAVRAHRLAPKRYWYFYNLAVMAAAILSLLGLASFKNTPEYTVARAFLIILGARRRK